MDYLLTYGWDDFFLLGKEDVSELEYGRIISVHKSRYEVFTRHGIFSCEILGNIQFQKKEKIIPAVGDWVLLDNYRDTYVIVSLLKRKNCLTRQKKHDRFPKPFAANIDKAFIVQSAEKSDFNIKRIERILVHLEKENIQPVIVINKIDLINQEKLDSIKKNIKLSFPDIISLYISAEKKIDIHKLSKYLLPQETVIFIGSSGVGKSSLLNILSEKEQVKTQSVSNFTGKGKHTTSARKLFKLDSGVLIIDTPGTREFGMHDDDFIFEKAFSLISQKEKECYFSNCSHFTEKGCAVCEAIKNQEINQEAFDRYKELKQEQQKTAKQMRVSKNKYRGVSRSLRLGKNKKPKK